MLISTVGGALRDSLDNGAPPNPGLDSNTAHIPLALIFSEREDF